MCGLIRAWVATLMAMLFLMQPAVAAVSDRVGAEAVTATLVTAENAVAPDASTLSAGLDLTLGHGWKTYWRSPGEVGIPPEISWEGSENVASVEMLWPAPTRFRAFGIENFGYANHVTFPLQVRLADPGAPVALRASVDLLVCSDICVLQTLDLSLELPTGSGIDTASAELIGEAAARVPDAEAAGIMAGTAHLDTDRTALTVTARSDAGFTDPDVFPELNGATFGAPDIRLGDGGKLLWARLPVLAVSDAPTDLRVTVSDGPRAGTLTIPWTDNPHTPPFALDRVVPGMSELAWIAMVAFLGGLILNVMPCVLPVLSIKLLSAINMQDLGPGRVRGGFLVSALGVLAFMWLLAAGTIAAKTAGLAVGWGLQFQNPVFLAAMIGVLALFAANMFGLFEIALPQSWSTALARGQTRKGYGGDFAAGAFAAILATPCSAPFLGTSIAFALAGRAVDVAVVFTALGLGMALPYLLLAARPSLVRALPKPGRWMLGLKVILGGLLLVTAGWLIWVLVGLAGSMVAALVAALVTLGVVLAWQAHRLPDIAVAFSLAAAGAGVLAAPVLTTPAPPSAATATQWQGFDRGDIARRVSTGQVVFVDVTADWCLTCKANKALVLDRGAVADALSAPDVVSMQADWTRPDPEIARYLESHGRFGIPFNIVYGPGAPEGISLPELLTAEAVLAALTSAQSRTEATR
jgi:suppressor for copper-sensitivity B